MKPCVTGWGMLMIRSTLSVPPLAPIPIQLWCVISTALLAMIHDKMFETINGMRRAMDKTQVLA